MKEISHHEQHEDREPDSAASKANKGPKMMDHHRFNSRPVADLWKSFTDALRDARLLQCMTITS